MKKVDIKNRFTGAVIFAAEVADDDAYPMRTAVKQAILAGAYLAGANLAGANLAGAYLAGAYLADANLAGAYLAGAYLARANLAGADLAGANLAGADLAGADLAGAYLARANLAGAYLADAYLAGAYLAGANLAGADLAGAYLARANLAGAYLADADLAGAYLADAYLADAKNVLSGVTATDPPTPYERKVLPRVQRLAERAKAYREQHPEVPVVERLDAKILEHINGGPWQLEMGSWHGGEPENGTACGTTHCRGGSAIMLAGKAGLDLEQKYGVGRAASMIYRASTGRVPHFFASNEAALADIRRCAAEQSTNDESSSKNRED